MSDMKKVSPAQIIRSNRKTISIQVDRDANVIVRAPYRVSEREIRRFLAEKEAWIRKHQEKIRAQEKAFEGIKPLTREEIEMLADQAMKVIPERVAYYAKKIGVTYGRITIRNQKTRWGSCSSKGNLNFNCLLMLTPPEVIDSVVVHELCHRKEMNHSAKFYDEIYRVCPAYDKWNRWLKENGPLLLRRMTGK
ncbi:MAG: M48 family metallopeptidase [Eubacterium sp.]|nr:M48 family metallopeptidase [Eubacterium sp.]